MLGVCVRLSSGLLVRCYLLGLREVYVLGLGSGYVYVLGVWR